MRGKRFGKAGGTGRRRKWGAAKAGGTKKAVPPRFFFKAKEKTVICPAKPKYNLWEARQIRLL